MGKEMVTESTPPASSAFEQGDIELVKLFLNQYKEAEGNSYKERPDVTKRNERPQKVESILSPLPAK